MVWYSPFASGGLPPLHKKYFCAPSCTFGTIVYFLVLLCTFGTFVLSLLQCDNYFDCECSNSKAVHVKVFTMPLTNSWLLNPTFRLMSTFKAVFDLFWNKSNCTNKPNQRVGLRTWYVAGPHTHQFHHLMIRYVATPYDSNKPTIYILPPTLMDNVIPFRWRLPLVSTFFPHIC